MTPMPRQNLKVPPTPLTSSLIHLAKLSCSHLCISLDDFVFWKSTQPQPSRVASYLWHRSLSFSYFLAHKHTEKHTWQKMIPLRRVPRRYSNPCEMMSSQMNEWSLALVAWRGSHLLTLPHRLNADRFALWSYYFLSLTQRWTWYLNPPGWWGRRWRRRRGGGGWLLCRFACFF